MQWLTDTLDWLGGVIAALAITVFGPEPSADLVYGYAEGEYVRLAAVEPGQIERIAVERGARVEAGQVVFTLDDARERAARDEAAARLANAEAVLRNLQKGRRQTEIAAMEAQRDQADASLRLTEAQLRRTESLAATSVAAVDRLDTARAAVERDRARLAEMSAQIASARLAARSDEIRAAEAQVAAAEAALRQAEWRLGQRSGVVPVAGAVSDVPYRAGEFVASGAPIVVILPPDCLKVRFFVPQALRGRLAIGQELRVSWDGGAQPVAAELAYLASEAEFTPPVLYTREQRQKFVFLAEARLRAPAPALHPGQPVEVRLLWPN
jgi:HlyD family secretion protein